MNKETGRESGAGFFGSLEALRERPVPGLAAARAARVGYRRHPIDRAAPEAPAAEAASPSWEWGRDFT